MLDPHSLSTTQWLFESGHLSHTPSQRSDKKSYSEEMEERKKLVIYMTGLCKRLQNYCSQKSYPPEKRTEETKNIIKMFADLVNAKDVTTTASAFIHRYLMRYPLSSCDLGDLAATCLFLALKVEERTCVRMSHIAKVAIEKETGGNAYKHGEPGIKRKQEKLALLEDQVLEALCFDLAIDQPLGTLLTGARFLSNYGVASRILSGVIDFGLPLEFIGSSGKGKGKEVDVTGGIGIGIGGSGIGGGMGSRTTSGPGSYGIPIAGSTSNRRSPFPLPKPRPSFQVIPIPIPPPPRLDSNPYAQLSNGSRTPLPTLSNLNNGGSTPNGINVFADGEMKGTDDAKLERAALEGAYIFCYETISTPLCLLSRPQYIAAASYLISLSHLSEINYLDIMKIVNEAWVEAFATSLRLNEGEKGLKEFKGKLIETVELILKFAKEGVRGLHNSGEINHLLRHLDYERIPERQPEPEPEPVIEELKPKPLPLAMEVIAPPLLFGEDEDMDIGEEEEKPALPATGVASEPKAKEESGKDNLVETPAVEVAEAMEVDPSPASVSPPTAPKASEATPAPAIIPTKPTRIPFPAIDPLSPPSPTSIPTLSLTSIQAKELDTAKLKAIIPVHTPSSSSILTKVGRDVGDVASELLAGGNSSGAAAGAGLMEDVAPVAVSVSALSKGLGVGEEISQSEAEMSGKVVVGNVEDTEEGEVAMDLDD